jgi:GT2 family glycosyltransferase
MESTRRDITNAPGKAAPFVSVVIPTYGRPEVLADTIRYLLAQDYPRYEIIVVDQTEETTAARRAPVFDDARVSYAAIRERGPQAAKNFGIGRARGDIILTVDDDIIPEPDLIAQHVKNYDDPKIGAVGGRVFSPGEGETDHRKIGVIKPNGIVLGNYTSRRKKPISTVFGCNFSFRKAAFETVGQYDTRYIGNFVREETDLCARIIKAGYTIIFEPDARVIHLRAPSGGCRVENDLLWQFYFLHNNTLFFLSHMKRWFLPFFLFEHLKRAFVYFYHHGKKPAMLLFLIRGMYLGAHTYRTGGVDTALLDRYLAAADKFR